MRIIIFGTGRYCQKRKCSLAGIDIVAFLDSDSDKQNSIVDGKPVFLPQEVTRLSYDYICIMSGPYFEEMKGQLISLGLSSEKIIDYNKFLGMTGGQILCYQSVKEEARLGRKRNSGLSVPRQRQYTRSIINSSGKRLNFYEELFSIEAFEKNLANIIENCVK